jgi:hypothetical protein
VLTVLHGHQDLLDDGLLDGEPQQKGRTISAGLRIWRLGVRIPRGTLISAGQSAYRRPAVGVCLPRSTDSLTV